MNRDTEIKLYGAIDILESALNAICQDPAADVSCRISVARDNIRAAIAAERKVTDGNTEHPHCRPQAG